MLMQFEEVWTKVILFLPRLGISLLIFLGFWIVAKVNRGVVQRFGQSKRLSPDIVKLLEQITEVSLLFFGIVSAFGTLGVDVGAMIASLGLVGFALGFALKDLLSNLLSGLLILIYKPFIRGDHISVSGNEGSVVEVNLRYTVLITEEKKVLIPNSTLFVNPVTVSRPTPLPAPASEAAASSD